MRKIFLLAAVLALTACGGGGDSGTTDAQALTADAQVLARKCRWNCPAPTPTYTLTVTEPGEGAAVSGTVTMRGNAAGFQNVEVFYGDTMIARAAMGLNGDYAASVNTSSIPNGSQPLMVRAWDSPAGQPFTQTKSVTRTVNVQNATEPTPSPTPEPDPVTGVSLTNYGAKCDGVTDDTAAINRGIADARTKGVPLVVPEGQCNFSQVLRLDSAKITGYGPTSILYATNYTQASIFMYGAAPSVTKIKLTGARTTRRAEWEATKITTFGARDFVIDSVTIEWSPAASIQTAPNSTRGRITNNVIRDSQSDSIHITDGASYITVEGNTINNSGDDGIAVVSYGGNPVPVNNITARNNIVTNNKGGRNMSVVGGRDVLYENNLLQGNPNWACMYFAQEASYGTWNVVGVTARNNTMQNCGSLSTGHTAIMIYSDGGNNDNILVQRNDIKQDGRNGIRYYGPQTRIVLDQNRYTGTGQAYIDGGGSQVTVTPYSSGPVGYVAP